MRSTQKGKGKTFISSFKKHNNSSVQEKISKLKESIASLKTEHTKLDTQANIISEEMMNHNNNAVRLRDNKKIDEALAEFKKYKTKKIRLERIINTKRRLTIVLIDMHKKLNNLRKNNNSNVKMNNPLYSQSKSLRKKNNNNNSNFKMNNPLYTQTESLRKNNNNNNPLYSRSKSLKRSNGSRNLYSNVNSEYGKLKRELELPVNASRENIRYELLTGARPTTQEGYNQLSNLEGNLELEEMRLQEMMKKSGGDTKSLKHSKGSRNLYSNANSAYGKLKRELELPANANIDDVLNKLKNSVYPTTQKGLNQLHNLELNLELQYLMNEDDLSHAIDNLKEDYTEIKKNNFKESETYRNVMKELDKFLK